MNRDLLHHVPGLDYDSQASAGPPSERRGSCMCEDRDRHERAARSDWSNSHNQHNACPTDRRGRRTPETAHAAAASADPMTHAPRPGKRRRQLYARRQAIVEPFFGQIKHNRNIGRVKRAERAAGPGWRLITATHNLRAQAAPPQQRARRRLNHDARTQPRAPTRPTRNDRRQTFLRQPPCNGAGGRAEGEVTSRVQRRVRLEPSRLDRER